MFTGNYLDYFKDTHVGKLGFKGTLHLFYQMIHVVFTLFVF